MKTRSWPLVVVGLVLLANGCSFATKMQRLAPGISQADVIRILGKPDGFKTESDSVTLTWTGRSTAHHGGIADCYVVLKNDCVVEYGMGDVQLVDSGDAIVVISP